MAKRPDRVVPVAVPYGAKKKKNTGDHWWQDKDGNWHYSAKGNKNKEHTKAGSKSYTEKFGGSAKERAKEKIGPRDEDQSKKDYRKELAAKTADLKERRQGLRRRLLKDRFGEKPQQKLAGGKQELSRVRTAKRRLEALRGQKGELRKSLKQTNRELADLDVNTGDPDSLAKKKALEKRIQQTTRQKERLGERSVKQRRRLDPYRNRKERVLNKQFAEKKTPFTKKAVKEYDSAQYTVGKAEALGLTGGATKSGRKPTKKGKHVKGRYL